MAMLIWGIGLQKGCFGLIVRVQDLSNMYAKRGRWADVVKMRGSKRQKGDAKQPGCSWILDWEESTCVYGER